MPVDRKQCQAEKPNGTSFMTMGGEIGKKIRCRNRPSYIITEKEKRKGWNCEGSMSLCYDCLQVAKEQLGDSFTIKEIK